MVLSDPRLSWIAVLLDVLIEFDRTHGASLLVVRRAIGWIAQASCKSQSCQPLDVDHAGEETLEVERDRPHATHYTTDQNATPPPTEVKKRRKKKRRRNTRPRTSPNKVNTLRFLANVLVRRNATRDPDPRRRHPSPDLGSRGGGGLLGE